MRPINGRKSEVSGIFPIVCPSDAYSLWSAGILRGANVFQGRNPGGASTGFGDGDFTQADFDDLAAAGANYVQISHAGLFAETPPYALDSAAEANLDRIVAMAGAANLYAVIALRSGPGRNENAISNRDGPVLETIWTDAAARDAWVDMLRHTAERYGPNPTVIGYSIMVEPNDYARRGFIDPGPFYAQFAGTLEDVNVLYAMATTAIRAVDPETPILLEPEGYGNVTWLPFVTPIAAANMVYTAHDYTPFDYSHQQVPNASYPGTYTVEGVPARSTSRSSRPTSRRFRRTSTRMACRWRSPSSACTGTRRTPPPTWPTASRSRTCSAAGRCGCGSLPASSIRSTCTSRPPCSTC